MDRQTMLLVVLVIGLTILVLLQIDSIRFWRREYMAYVKEVGDAAMLDIWREGHKLAFAGRFTEVWSIHPKWGPMAVVSTNTPEEAAFYRAMFSKLGRCAWIEYP